MRRDISIFTAGVGFILTLSSTIAIARGDWMSFIIGFGFFYVGTCINERIR